MSVKIMAALYERRLGSPEIKAVALKLADCANDDGRSIYPSKCTIAHQTELSEATVYRSIRKLLAMGLLVVERQSRGGKRKDTTVYAISLSVLSGLPLSVEPLSNRHPCPSDTPVSETGTGVPQTGDGCPPDTQPIKESSISVSKARARAKPPAADTNENSFSGVRKREFPRPLPEDWVLPDEWRSECEETHPDHAGSISAEASSFRRYNAKRMTVATAEEWRDHWRNWWIRAMARTPSARLGAKLREYDAGPTVHNSEEPFQEYMARMIREGKYKPKEIVAC